MTHAKCLLAAALVGLALGAPAVAADSDSLSREELQTQVKALQDRLTEAEGNLQRAIANREAAVAVTQQLEKTLRDSTDRFMAEKQKLAAEIERLRKAHESVPVPPGLTAAQFPWPGMELVTLPVITDQPVKYGNSIDVKGEFPAGPDAKEKTRIMTVIRGAAAVAINGVMASPEPGVKIETIQVMIPKEDAARMPQITKLVVGGKFTVSPPSVPRLTSEALDLLAREDLAPPKVEVGKAVTPTAESPKSVVKVGPDGRIIPPVPVRIAGHVTKADNEAQVAEIDVGSADGVVKGMQFIVADEVEHRYLATLTITNVAEKSSGGNLSAIRQVVNVGSAVATKTTE